MINFDSPRNLIIGVFILIVFCVGAGVAMTAGKGNMSKAASSFGVVLIAVAILGLGGLGVALIAFGGRILASFGLNVGA